MKVFAVNGVSLSGKDTFCNFVRNAYALDRCVDKNMSMSQIMHYYGSSVKTISTIDPVKEIYKRFFGWDGTKDDKHRGNLNTLKLMWIDVSDGPSNWLKNTLLELQEWDMDIVFIMVREFDEMITAINIGAEICGYAETIQLIRNGIHIPPVEQKFLDSHPKDYIYDWTIVNHTVDTFPDVPKLEHAANAFFQIIKNRDVGIHQTKQLVWNPVDETFFEWIVNLNPCNY